MPPPDDDTPRPEREFAVSALYATVICTLTPDAAALVRRLPGVIEVEHLVAAGVLAEQDWPDEYAEERWRYRNGHPSRVGGYTAPTATMEQVSAAVAGRDLAAEAAADALVAFDKAVEDETLKRMVRLRADEEARQRLGKTRAAQITLPPRVDLENYTPPQEVWVVSDLIPMGTSAGLFSEKKVGKTTTTVALVWSLLTGEPFLGRFGTRLPAAAEVVLLDTEMGTDMMHYEFTRAGVTGPLFGRVNYHDLMGQSRLLDMRDEAVRARWREVIAPGSFLIVDCLYTVLSALGIDENASQVADVLEGIKTLAVACEAAGWVIAHHLGKDPDKGARGHSSIEGAVGTIVTLRADGPLDDPETVRTLSAIGRRGVQVAPGALTLRDGRLGMSEATPRAERRTRQDRSDDDITWAVVNAHPGLSLKKLETLPKETRHISQGRLSAALRRLDRLGHVANEGTDDRPAWHSRDRGGDPVAVALADPAAVPVDDDNT